MSACLADAGKKVLLVDLDPQGNASSGLGIEKDDLELCVHRCSNRWVSLLLILFSLQCLKAICGAPTIQLAGAEVELVSACFIETMLKKLWHQCVMNMILLSLIVRHPLVYLTLNAFTAADSVLIPIQSEFYALEGKSVS